MNIFQINFPIKLFQLLTTIAILPTLQNKILMSNANSISEFEWPTNITDRIKYFPRELKSSTNVPNGISSGSNCTKDTDLCPYVSNTVDVKLVQPRSVAPYVWTRNANPLRYPAVVWEACCVCRHCYDPRHRSYLGRGELSVSNIRITVNVGIRDSVNNKVTIRAEKFTVGCTCKALNK